jgi:adenine deaminase
MSCIAAEPPTPLAVPSPPVTRCAMEHSAFKPWSDAMPRLVAVAAGREKADLVIRGGHVVNVHTREVLDGWDVAVADGRFAYVGPDASHCIGPGTEVIDATGHFLSPASATGTCTSKAGC